MEAIDILRDKGVKRIGHTAFRAPCSTVSACLATPFRIKGINYSIASACATSAHCIGHAMEQIQMGKQDVVFAGGGEEEHWSQSCLFDAMGALSSQYNETPEKASRAYDAKRDGFVIAGGGGMVVVEELEHALKRGAKIYAEIVGYGATSDGYDMVAPSGEGALRCMQQAMSTVEGSIDYLNTHGTSTPVGDGRDQGRAQHVRRQYPDHQLDQEPVRPFAGRCRCPRGDLLDADDGRQLHRSLGQHRRAGPGSRGHADPAETRENAQIDTIMSNSFGFGGTNATLVLRRYKA